MAEKVNMTPTAKQQAVMDRDDVLEAIDSRMGKLGTDHDLLIKIDNNLTNLCSTVSDHDDILRGAGQAGGLLAEHEVLKTRMALLFGGLGILSAATVSIGIYVAERLMQVR